MNKHTNKERTVLAAKFATADYLIVINRKEDLQVKKSEPIFYDAKYDTKMIDRVASLKINVRILSRDGSIVWINDLSGEAKDRVVPQFVKKKGSEHKKHDLNKKKNKMIKWFSSDSY